MQLLTCWSTHQILSYEVLVSSQDRSHYSASLKSSLESWGQSLESRKQQLHHHPLFPENLAFHHVIPSPVFLQVRNSAEMKCITTRTIRLIWVASSKYSLLLHSRICYVKTMVIYRNCLFQFRSENFIRCGLSVNLLVSGTRNFRGPATVRTRCTCNIRSTCVMS